MNRKRFGFVKTALLSCLALAGILIMAGCGGNEPWGTDVDLEDDPGGGRNPVVTGVAITTAGNAASASAGTSLQFYASVSGENNPAQTVTWSITTTGKHANTKINTSGRLTIAAAELKPSITVKAISTVNPGKSKIKTITVTRPPVAVVATVSDIDVTTEGDATSVPAGGSLQFFATVNGANGPAQTVNWTILTEDIHADTTINDDGLLTVSVEETQPDLVIEAESAVNSDIAGTNTITVIPSRITTFATGLYHPTEITVDGDGNVYVLTDSGGANKNLLKIPPEGGSLETIANGPLSEIRADSLGNVYAIHVQSYSYSIYKIAPGGQSVFAGGNTTGPTEGPGAAVSFHPYVMTIDSANNLYVMDFHAINWQYESFGRICKITPDAMVTTIADSIQNPRSIAVDGEGYLYIEHLNSTTSLKKRTTDGELADDVVTGLTTFDLYLTEGRDGNAYAITGGRIYQIMPDSPAVPIVGAGSQVEVPFSPFTPYDVAVDNNGVMYVTDYSSGRIYKIMPESNE